MAEETIWSGTPSQLKNAGAYALCILVVPVLVAAWLLLKLPVYVLSLEAVVLLYAGWKWLLLKSHSYRLTTERLLITSGILSKCTESLELYRVKDLRMTQPVIQRMFGLETIELSSSDQDTPELLIDYLPKNLELGDKIRHQVEVCRVQKRTREVELE